jgi:hypothetical protein
MTPDKYTRVDDCFCLDDSGNIWFCISNFLHANELPDDPRLILVVIEELLDIFPEVQLLYTSPEH